MSTIADKLTRLAGYKEDIKQAIIDKDQTVGDNMSEYANAIKKISGGGGDTTHRFNAIGYTGNADVEGLKAIGWSYADIADFQEWGVCWNEENDDLYKVSDANKETYTKYTTCPTNAVLLTMSLDEIMYLPKWDFSSITSAGRYFYMVQNVWFMPSLSLPNCTNLTNTFHSAFNLRYIGEINAPKLTTSTNIFYNPLLSSVVFTNSGTAPMTNMSAGIYNVQRIILDRPIDFKALNTAVRYFIMNGEGEYNNSNGFVIVSGFGQIREFILNDNAVWVGTTSIQYMFRYIQTLEKVWLGDLRNITTLNSWVGSTSNIKSFHVKNWRANLTMPNLCDKESVDYCIRNLYDNTEATAEEAFTITISAYSSKWFTQEEKEELNAIAIEKNWNVVWN